MSRLQALISSIRELLQSWHSVDRVRISPNEGRMLRLRVGDSFVLVDSLYTVEQRRVDTCGDGYNVVYGLLNSVDEVVQLSVDATASQTPAGRLISRHLDVFVFDSDVFMLPDACVRSCR